MVLCSFIPFVADSVQVEFDPDSAEKYPALYEAYERLAGEHSLIQMIPEDSVRIVTVRNLWSRCEYYILPCYLMDIGTVPHAGSLHWRASVYILAVCSKDTSVAAKICPLDVREFSLEMEPGNNTFLYSYADIAPGDMRVDTPQKVTIQDRVNCRDNPQITVTYTVATASGAEARDERTRAGFDWYYSLYFCGKPLAGYHESVGVDYFVNS